MYRPPANRVDDLSVAVRIVRDHGFGHLVVAGPDGLDAVPVPVIVDVPADDEAADPPIGAGLRVRGPRRPGQPDLAGRPVPGAARS